VRLGGLYRLGALDPRLDNLTLRAGGLLETSAVPEARQSLDLMHWARGAASAGLGMQFGAMKVEIAYLHYFQADRQVRTSEVVQTVALPDIPAAVVGNGDYSSNIDLFSLSLGYRFD
jgi:long-subunit fatty acid transport protein